jgi:hypothetical protein
VLEVVGSGSEECGVLGSVYFLASHYQLRGSVSRVKILLMHHVGAGEDGVL